MNQSSYSFEYISGENIETMLKAIDFSEANNLGSIIDQQCKHCMIQDWVDNLQIHSGENIDLEDLQMKVKQFKLPELELVHKMSLHDITEYEAFLVDNLDNIPLNNNVTAKFLLHLKIIKIHLVNKFRIFE